MLYLSPFFGFLFLLPTARSGTGSYYWRHVKHGVLGQYVEFDQIHTLCVQLRDLANAVRYGTAKAEWFLNAVSLRIPLICLMHGVNLES